MLSRFILTSEFFSFRVPLLHFCDRHRCKYHQLTNQIDLIASKISVSHQKYNNASQIIRGGI